MPTDFKLLFLDFETYYDNEYSLRKMPTPIYILDPRFECQMVAVEEFGVGAQIIDGKDFPHYLKQFDPRTTTTVTFNALFDNSILAWRYGFVPVRMLDSMGMARALLGHKLVRFSLAAIAEALGLGAKGGALVKVLGMRADEIKSRGLWREFSAYALQDNVLNRDIFLKLIPHFPVSERRLMDLTLRCAIQPRFRMDIGMLTQHLAEVRGAKAELLAGSGVGLDQLMSTQKFKEALEALGVTVEMKVSPNTGRETPAFAKTDEFMAKLQEHDDPAVQQLAAARLGFKSTLEETRCEKLLSVASLPWDFLGGPTMPIPLRYGGAHTHRLSGEWGMNMQNLPTVRGSKGKSKLRLGLGVPEGHSIVAADLGQIEARLVAWICGCLDLLQQFRDKLDPYAIMGGQIFGYEVDPLVHKLERFIGKTAILGLGYGCGATKFFNMVVMLARALGLDLGGMWTMDLAQQSVDTYRRVYSPIKDGWYKLDRAIRTAWLGKGGPVTFGPVTIEYGEVKLPSGLSLKYDRPSFDEVTQEHTYYYGKFKHKIYGAKLLENIVQALARIVVMNAALRIADRGYSYALQAHDELVFVVPNSEVDKAKQIIHEEMTRPPSWAPTLPLTATVGVGPNYGEAK